MAKRFKYTSRLKPETQGGSAAVLMGGISGVLFIIGAITAFIGWSSNVLGVIGLMGILLAVCGFFIGLHSFSEKDKNHRYSTIGSLACGIIAVIWLAVYLVGIR